MQITLLVDNEASEGLRSEHGLSFIVETDEGSVVFDTGQTDAWLHNMQALGKDLDTVRSVAASHGHYDHTGGIAAALAIRPDLKVSGHRDCLKPRYVAEGDTKRYIGIPDRGLASHFDFDEEPKELLPGVALSGKIPIRYRSPNADSARFLLGTKFDPFDDEQCLVLKSKDSVVALLGCSHRGVENNILAAMDTAGSSRLDLVIGGMHLGSAGQARLGEIASFLDARYIGQIVCCHCTGIGAYEYLRQKLGPRVTLGRTGMSWQI